MEALAERGNRVVVIMNEYFDYTPRYIKKIILSIKYTYRGFPPASYLFRKSIKKNIRFIKKQLEQYHGKETDFIHIHGDTHLKGTLFLKNYFSLPLFYTFRCNDIDRAHILRKSRSLSLREYFFSLIYEPINRFREKQVARYAELITIQNHFDIKRFIERTNYPTSKTVIIPGNIGLPRCVPEWKNKNISTKIEKIVYVGSLNPTKGLWQLLNALVQLVERGYCFLQCRILGRLENAEPVIGLIKKLGIEENVSLEGFRNPFPYLAENDLMVYPTLYDAFPDTVLEALHTGCPVIASAVGGLPDLLQYKELLFTPGSVAEIRDKIEKCVTDPLFYNHVRELCAKRAEVYHFDWAEQFENAMRSYIFENSACSI
jgi:glycosyltransferase involved in cell wall biosynthesis